ncbi:hypothetical protein BCR33DRAFT_485870 [Rhizoclosmatium globosum]|uniref:Uncharacterized protein n=1 Tax=Rhizoclosmatium globosum TaxID=329046 RepID=A0A1Y2BN36_9FUNG|nr:hypothetical protein BCR33DRAFT_485870 [Rhizoclosmatium globosum]|eukprot:ORY36176.1 hypothetical protein BCR33DRAFT_485870 [Rhizoclosmatium globosum]
MTLFNVGVADRPSVGLWSIEEISQTCCSLCVLVVDKVSECMFVCFYYYFEASASGAFTWRLLLVPRKRVEADTRYPSQLPSR